MCKKGSYCADLKGNCTARKAYDFSLQNDRAQKVMNFKKNEGQKLV